MSVKIQQKKINTGLTLH